MADWYNPICNHNPYRGHFRKGPGNALRSDDRDREHGRIYSIYPRGTQDEPYPALQTGPEALAALDHPNLFWRLTAQRLLAQSLDSKTLAAKSEQSPNPRARFHLALAAHHRRLDAVQAAAMARRIELDEGRLGRNQAVIHSPAVNLKRLQDAGRDPLDRKAAALRLVEAPPSARLGEDLLHLVVTDSTIAGSNHLADAVRLAVIRHPEGFFRALLEEKAEHKFEGFLGKIVQDALARIRRTPEIISKGLRVFAHQSNSSLARQLAEAAEASPPTTPKTTLSPGARRGEQVYLACCVACHQPEGQGLPKVFPPLAGSKRLLGPTEVPIRIVLKGLQGPLRVNGEQYDSMMPGHEALLTDQQVADVLNYTRASWGNRAGEVSEESVRAVRASVARRTSPWTEPELRSRK